MSPSNIPDDRRAFHCSFCKGKILIPKKLPPTSGPCPHCGETITSPPLLEIDDLPDDFAEPNKLGSPTRLTNRADLPKLLGAEQILDDLGDINKTPIKLGLDQYVDDEPVIKSAKPRKQAANKPVIARQTEKADVSSNHHTEFQQFLIAEARAHTRKMIITTVLIVLFVAFGSSYYVYHTQQRAKMPKHLNVDDTPKQPLALTDEYINGNWTNEAHKLLRGFLNATAPYNKSPYILNSADTLPDLEKFYDGMLINDLDTPEDAFKINPLSPEEHQRGLFRLSFRGTDTQRAREAKNIPAICLPYLANPDITSNQPTCVDAYFLHTKKGLKLDWHIFAQTKYRTLYQFTTRPSPKRKAMFRVLISKDNSEEATTSNGTHYYIADPANPSDVIRAAADPGSITAKTLVETNWGGSNGSPPITRNATIELAWRGDGNERKLVIHSLTCWEFIGLGAPPHPDAPNNLHTP